MSIDQLVQETITDPVNGLSVDAQLKQNDPSGTFHDRLHRLNIMGIWPSKSHDDGLGTLIEKTKSVLNGFDREDLWQPRGKHLDVDRSEISRFTKRVSQIQAAVKKAEELCDEGLCLDCIKASREETDGKCRVSH